MTLYRVNTTTYPGLTHRGESYEVDEQRGTLTIYEGLNGTGRVVATYAAGQWVGITADYSEDDARARARMREDYPDIPHILYPGDTCRCTDRLEARLLEEIEVARAKADSFRGDADAASQLADYERVLQWLRELAGKA